MRLLLLEDDEILGEGLRDYLQSEGHVVDWFRRLADAKAVGNEPFDVLLIDWQLPDGSGLEWLVRLRRNHVTTPALVLSARDLLSQRIEGLDCGADDYLVKPFDPSELVARIRSVRRRIAAHGLSRLRFGPVEVDLATATVYLNGDKVELTGREWTLLDALINRAGRIVAKRDLESLITGHDGEINSNALEVHVFKLRRKLGQGIIETVRGRGYRIGATA